MFLECHSRFCSYNRYIFYQISNRVINNYVKCALYSTSYAHKKSDKASDSDNVIENKIIYNSVIKKLGFIAKKRQEWKELNKLRKSSENPLPLSLKYFKEELTDTIDNEHSVPKEQRVNLPYSVKNYLSDRKLHLSEESCSTNRFVNESDNTTSLDADELHLNDLISDSE